MNEEAHIPHLWGFSPPPLVLEVEAIVILKCLFVQLFSGLGCCSLMFLEGCGSISSSYALHESVGLTEGKSFNVYRVKRKSESEFQYLKENI